MIDWLRNILKRHRLRSDYGAINEHNGTGKRGEDIAASLLRKKGYKIVAMNWKVGHLEMDIIAENKKEIVFVEVKTRTSTYGNKRAEEYVNLPKKRRIVAAANVYIRKNHIEKSPRFDIVGIQMDRRTGEAIEITHLENAFTPPQRTINEKSFSGEWRWKHRSKTIK